jgi:hypothetical protein
MRSIRHQLLHGYLCPSLTLCLDWIIKELSDKRQATGQVEDGDSKISDFPTKNAVSKHAFLQALVVRPAIRSTSDRPKCSICTQLATFGLYFVAALSNNALFSSRSARKACCGSAFFNDLQRS